MWFSIIKFYTSNILTEATKSDEGQLELELANRPNKPFKFFTYLYL